MVTRENITSKQRAALKSMASTMSPIAQIGKGGITDNLLKTLSDALEARELIKVNILPNSDDDARNLAENVADLLDAIPVAVIGRKAIFYRRSNRFQLLGKRVANIQAYPHHRGGNERARKQVFYQDSANLFPVDEYIVGPFDFGL